MPTGLCEVLAQSDFKATACMYDRCTRLPGKRVSLLKGVLLCVCIPSSSCPGFCGGNHGSGGAVLCGLPGCGHPKLYTVLQSAHRLTKWMLLPSLMLMTPSDVPIIVLSESMHAGLCLKQEAASLIHPTGGPSSLCLAVMGHVRLVKLQIPRTY